MRDERLLARCRFISLAASLEISQWRLALSVHPTGRTVPTVTGPNQAPDSGSQERCGGRHPGGASLVPPHQVPCALCAREAAISKELPRAVRQVLLFLSPSLLLLFSV